MSNALKSTARNEPAGRGQAANPPHSDSVAVTLTGWLPGMEKVSLSLMMRDSGLSLKQATEITRKVLDNEAVSVTLPQFASAEEAIAALARIGVKAH